MTEYTEHSEEKPLNQFGEMELSSSPDYKGAVAPLKFDADEYRGEFEDCNLTIEQQDEMLRALWDIVVTMVDIGFGLDSTQIVLNDFTEALAEISSDESQYGKTKEHSQPQQQKGLEHATSNDE